MSRNAVAVRSNPNLVLHGQQVDDPDLPVALVITAEPDDHPCVRVVVGDAFTTGAAWGDDVNVFSFIRSLLPDDHECLGNYLLIVGFVDGEWFGAVTDRAHVLLLIRLGDEPPRVAHAHAVGLNPAMSVANLDTAFRVTKKTLVFVRQ